MQLSLDVFPFSAFGNYTCISSVHRDDARGIIRDAGIFLRAQHGRDHSIVRLVPMRGDVEVHVDVDMQPHLLTFTDHAGGRIEICFEPPDTVRLRGSGMSLRLIGCAGFTHYQLADNRVTINARKACHKYEVECLRGSVVVQSPWQTGPDAQAVIDLLPEADGAWEAAVDEHTTTWSPRKRRSFDEAARLIGEDFARWLERTLPVPEKWSDARLAASYIQWSCVVHPEGLLEHSSMFMSMNWMGAVWNWDNCFNAMAIAGNDPQLAFDQLLLMADHQDRYGALPDQINSLSMHYNFCKPPVHGWTVGEILKAHPDCATPGLLRELYDMLSRWTTWWTDHRVLSGEVLPYYIHGNDSGWDNGTMFDAGMPVMGPDAAGYLVTQLDACAELADRLGRDKDAARWRDKSDRVLAAMLDRLWTGQRFVARVGLERQAHQSDSLLYTLGLLAGTRLPEDVREKTAEAMLRYETEWGLATEHPDSPHYEGDGYWRGPIWAPSTYIGVCALERAGCIDDARRIAGKFCRMCAEHGFAENFDALTGQLRRDPAYTWTSSVFLLLANRLLD